MFCNFYSVDSGFISPKKDSECEEGATPLLGDDLVNQAGIQRVDDLLKMLNKVTFKAKHLTSKLIHDSARQVLSCSKSILLTSPHQVRHTATLL